MRSWKCNWYSVYTDVFQRTSNALDLIFWLVMSWSQSWLKQPFTEEVIRAYLHEELLQYASLDRAGGWETVNNVWTINRFTIPRAKLYLMICDFSFSFFVFTPFGVCSPSAFTHLHYINKKLFVVKKYIYIKTTTTKISRLQNLYFYHKQLLKRTIVPSLAMRTWSRLYLPTKNPFVIKKIVMRPF